MIQGRLTVKGTVMDGVLDMYGGATYTAGLTAKWPVFIQ
jgi:hypothetical protein